MRILTLLLIISNYLFPSFSSANPSINLDGWVGVESNFKPEMISEKSFGKLWTNELDGNVYGALTYVKKNQSWKNTQNLIIAATVRNSIYALNENTGSVVWSREKLLPVSDETPPTECDWKKKPQVGKNPNLKGSVGGFYYDIDTKTIYYSANAEVNGVRDHYVWAINVEDGKTKKNWPIKLDPNPLTKTNKDFYRRGAINKIGDILVISVSSRCEFTDPSIARHYGMIYGIDVKNPHKQAVYVTAPKINGGALWSTRGPIVESKGYVYVVTSNCHGSDNKSFPKLHDYLGHGGENACNALLKLKIIKTPKQMRWKLTSFFTPSNLKELDEKDLDFGSGSPALFSYDGKGKTFLLHGGKDGIFREISTADENKLDPIPMLMLNSYRTETAIWGGPTIYKSNRSLNAVIVGDSKNYIEINKFQINTSNLYRSHKLIHKWRTRRLNIYKPGAPTVSINKGKDAIVWVTGLRTNEKHELITIGPDNQYQGVLCAFNAEDGSMLYCSNGQKNINRDLINGYGKWMSPLVVDDQILVGGNGVTSFGFLYKREGDAKRAKQ